MHGIPSNPSNLLAYMIWSSKHRRTSAAPCELMALRFHLRWGDWGIFDKRRLSLWRQLAIIRNLRNFPWSLASRWPMASRIHRMRYDGALIAPFTILFPSYLPLIRALFGCRWCSVWIHFIGIRHTMLIDGADGMQENHDVKPCDKPSFAERVSSINNPQHFYFQHPLCDSFRFDVTVE